MQGRNVVMIVDNCPAHPEVSGLKPINIVFATKYHFLYTADGSGDNQVCLLSYSNSNGMFKFCCRRSSLFKNYLITKIEAYNLEKKVELCGVKLSLSYEMPLAIIKEFETESVIKGYHAYMNDWTPILGENLSTRPEPETKIDKYVVAVTKDAEVIGNLKKGKTGRYAKTVFYFLRVNPMKTVSITGTGNSLSQKFPAQFDSTEKKNIIIEVLKK